MSLTLLLWDLQVPEFSDILVILHFELSKRNCEKTALQYRDRGMLKFIHFLKH